MLIMIISIQLTLVATLFERPVLAYYSLVLDAALEAGPDTGDEREETELPDSVGEKSDRACNTTRTHPWTHPGTYLGRLGFRIGNDRVYVEAGDCMSGIVNVTVNDQQLSVGDDFTFGGKKGKQSLIFEDEFTVRFHLLEVEIELQNSDNFFNQVVTLTRVGERTDVMHGLLGQTWRNKVYKDVSGKKHFIEGHPNDYLVQDDDLFGSDFLYNVFDQ